MSSCKRLPILVTQRWARSWSRCTGSQPTGDLSHPSGSRLPLLSARPAVTFPVAEHHRPLAGTYFTVPQRVEGWVDLGKCSRRVKYTHDVTYDGEKPEVSRRACAVTISKIALHIWSTSDRNSGRHSALRSAISDVKLGLLPVHAETLLNACNRNYSARCLVGFRRILDLRYGAIWRCSRVRL